MFWGIKMTDFSNSLNTESERGKDFKGESDIRLA